MLQNDLASTYINASWIRAFGSEQKRYIAAQGPMQQNLPQFVRMLWEHNVSVICMLTRLKEGPKKKCEPYFPSAPGKSLQFGDILITLVSAERAGTGRVISKLKLNWGRQEKFVSHVWYTAWPVSETRKPLPIENLLKDVSVQEPAALCFC